MCPFDVVRSEFSEAVRNSYESKNIDVLQKKYETVKSGENDKRTVLDQVMRDYLLQLLSKVDDNVHTWEAFVNFCILVCRKDMCTPTMPVVLLGDIFDASTLDKCEKLFEFVEKGVNIWKEDLFFSACKNNLLRMCNDLLRRLSRSQNTVFCGRILLFLAKFFPFSERSGLNIVSEFNLDNLTEFGNDTASTLKDMIVESEAEVEEDKKPDTKFKIDYNLYCKFWALQDFFRNPNQCYNKVNWKTFSTHAVNVLLAFSSFKLEELQGKQRQQPAVAAVAAAAAAGSSKQAQSPTRGSAARPHYFAKFLTNQKLLELQLSDSNFRRCVLLQFLIVFQYLNSPVKFKTESHELRTDQADWVRDTTQLVYKLLAETPPDGPDFVQAVQHILKREEHWNAWKNDGCPEFQKPTPQSPGSDELAEEAAAAAAAAERRRALNRSRRARKRLGDLMRDATAHKRFNMGNPELTRLWNLSPNNLDACKSRERDFLPSLEAYFEEAIEQTDPAAMVEDQYKRVNDGNFGWRALRLLARRSPHFFTHSNNPINKLPEYLENMIKKISKDRPSLQAAEEAGRPDLEPEMQGVVKEEEEEELLKAGGAAGPGPAEDGDAGEAEAEAEAGAAAAEDTAGRGSGSRVTQRQLAAVADQVVSDWRKLAAKLGFQTDEVEYFHAQKATDLERCQLMLQIWSEEEDEDDNGQQLAYVLEGLGHPAAAAALKARASP